MATRHLRARFSSEPHVATRAASRAGVWAAATLCAAVATASAQEVSEPGGAAAPTADAAEERFDVWEYRVLGANALPAQSVEGALYSHLGPQKVIGDVETARKALEEAYRAAGYSTVFVDIPEQTVD